ncbi:MAG: hypothetical protein WC915_01385 [archaeon]|jgi:hypothetical protein
MNSKDKFGEVDSFTNLTFEQFQKVILIFVPLSIAFVLNEIWLKENMLIIVLSTITLIIYGFIMIGYFLGKKEFQQKFGIFILIIGLLLPVLLITGAEGILNQFGNSYTGLIAVLAVVMTFIFTKMKNKEGDYYEKLLIVTLLILGVPLLTLIFTAFLDIFLGSVPIANTTLGIYSIIFSTFFFITLIIEKLAYLLYLAKWWISLKEKLYNQYHLIISNMAKLKNEKNTKLKIAQGVILIVGIGYILLAVYIGIINQEKIGDLTLIGTVATLIGLGIFFIDRATFIKIETCSANKETFSNRIIGEENKKISNTQQRKIKQPYKIFGIFYSIFAFIILLGYFMGLEYVATGFGITITILGVAFMFFLESKKI